MSKSITFLIAGVLISQALAESPSQQAVSLYQQGQAAEKMGDPVAAKNFYTRALEADPKNPDAIYSLKQLKIHSGAISAKGREAKFGAVQIPAYQLEEASLQEALMALQKIIETQSKDQVTPNFVVEDPRQTLATKKISLNLKSMPARAVMKYLLDQIGAKARYDEHAVVIVAL
jgi:tetratricopeptide (TPR) repeat protein